MARKQLNISKPQDTIPAVYDDVLKCIAVISDCGETMIDKCNPSMNKLRDIVPKLAALSQDDYAIISNLMEQVDELMDAIHTAQMQFDYTANRQMAKTAFSYSVKVRTKHGWARMPKNEYKISAANRARKSAYKAEMSRVMKQNSPRVLAAKLQIGSGLIPKFDIDLPFLGFQKRRMGQVVDTYNNMIDQVTRYQGELSKMQADIQKALSSIDPKIYPKVNQDLLMYTKIGALLNSSLSNMMATLKQASEYFSTARAELAALTQDIIRIRKVND